MRRAAWGAPQQIIRKSRTEDIQRMSRQTVARGQREKWEPDLRTGAEQSQQEIMEIAKQDTEKGGGGAGGEREG